MREIPNYPLQGLGAAFALEVLLLARVGRCSIRNETTIGALAERPRRLFRDFLQSQKERKIYIIPKNRGNKA